MSLQHFVNRGLLFCVCGFKGIHISEVRKLCPFFLLSLFEFVKDVSLIGKHGHIKVFILSINQKIDIIVMIFKPIIIKIDSSYMHA